MERLDEDKAIIGGGETVESIKVSDSKPDSLTSRIDATVKMEAGAQGKKESRPQYAALRGCRGHGTPVGLGRR